MNGFFSICQICSKILHVCNFHETKTMDTGLAGDRVGKSGEADNGLSRPDHLKKSEVTHTGEKPFGCPERDKRWVELHENIHTGEKPYKCALCDKSFSCADELKRHEATHTGERPFGCPECKKIFPKTSVMERHEKMHIGENPCKCPICDRGDSYTEELTSGMVHTALWSCVHTGDKPYGCTVWAKSFSRTEELKTHMKIHTKERPYNCSTGGRGFSQSFNLKKHQRNHNGENPYDTLGGASAIPTQDEVVHLIFMLDVFRIWASQTLTTTFCLWLIARDGGSLDESTRFTPYLTSLS